MQRKNTTLNGLCCDDTTSQPIVPDISIAMLISAAPRRMSLDELLVVVAEALFEAMIRSRIDDYMTCSVNNPRARIHG
ncbi:hypothetical protein QFZ99_002877 [Paraburkholderia atlantica]|uniref:hypothetical protein n=1 Tax=Paraburkholderia atlantica TaxID=2654982 RepID=UPI003D19241A